MALAGIASLQLIVEPGTKSGSAGCYNTHLHLEAAGIELARMIPLQEDSWR